MTAKPAFRPVRTLRGRSIVFSVLAGLLIPAESAFALDDAEERGAYLSAAAGCVACHTEDGGEPLAGGLGLETPFGTFFTPNLTPDPDTGLGSWQEEDFIRALKHGRSPDDAPYYPAFPYTAYSGMTDRDASDLWAYLTSIEPLENPVPDHDLTFPFSMRWTAGAWQALYFDPEEFVVDPDQSEAWNRGAYLVRHLGHCAECHSQRNIMGVVTDPLVMAGNSRGPDGKKVTNITPDKDQGIGDWSASDLDFFLKTGFLPDGDVAGGAMEDVIRDGTSKLTDEDRAAMVEYLLSLPPHPTP